jgi:hypothetical protein
MFNENWSGHVLTSTLPLSKLLVFPKIIHSEGPNINKPMVTVTYDWGLKENIPLKKCS